MKKETYISVDVECNGPCPGLNSMISVAAVAYDDVGNEIDFFSRNLEDAEGTQPDHKTMLEFWPQFPKAYQVTQINKQQPKEVMHEFAQWLSQYQNPVFVAWPVTFDFSFVWYYFQRYHGNCPFGFSGLDMKTLAMALLKTKFKDTTKDIFPSYWIAPWLPHTHIALDDAREQGHIFFEMLKDLHE